MSEKEVPKEEVLKDFRSGVVKLEEAVKGLSEEQLDLSLEPGKWSIRQVVHHLVDDCDGVSYEIKKALVLGDARISIEGHPGNEAWSATLDFNERKIDSSLGLIKAHRQYLADLLNHFSDAWDRTLTILDADGKEMQKVTIEDVVKMVSDHMFGHIAKIEEIKEKHGV